MSQELQRLRKYPLLQLPSKVTIGYRDYVIEEMPDEGKETHVGFHHGQSHSIELNSEYPPAEVVCTLLHELVHGIFDVSGFTFRSPEDEEDVTICLGNGLTGIFKSNPEVIAWILNTLNDAQQRELQEPA
jgi:hypothetical protein